MQNLQQLAIDAALDCKWEEAVSLNTKLLDENPIDIDALKRLGYAYIQTNLYEKAKKTYKKILSIDPFNCIAQKNLQKILSFKHLPKAKKKETTEHTHLSPSIFIEEPGKTKSVQLKNLAPTSILSQLQIADEVFLFPKKHTVEIRDRNKTYIGILPDDISFRLVPLMTGGNQYQACIKNIQKNTISVYIREVCRGKKFKFQPSFLSLNFEREKLKELKKHEEQETDKTNQEEDVEEE